SGSALSTVQVTLLGRAAVQTRTTGRTLDVPATRCKACEDRIEPAHRCGISADHHAVSPLESPDSATRSHINVVDSTRAELARPPNIIDVVRVAPVDENISRLQVRSNTGNRFIDRRCRDHQPNRTRPAQLTREISERARTDCSFVREPLRCGR